MNYKTLFKFLILFLLVSSCGNSNKYSNVKTITYEMDKIDTSQYCGKIIDDSTVIKKMKLRLLTAKSINRNKYEGEIVQEVLLEFDINGLVKKVSADTIFCVIQDEKKRNDIIKKGECIMQNDSIYSLISATQKKIILFHFREKIKLLDSLQELKPFRVVILGSKN